VVKPVPKIVFVFLGIMLLMDSLLGFTVIKQIQVSGWPVVEGVVTDIEIERQLTRRMECPVVQFRYEVDGASFDGDRFRAGGFCSSSRYDAESVVSGLVVGEPVPVYVNPRDPREAYLVAGIDRIEHLGLFALLPFNVFAIGWILEIASRVLLGRSLDGTVRYVTFDDEKQAVLPPLSALRFTMGALLVVGFLLAGGVIFLFQGISEAQYRMIWRALAVFLALTFVFKALLNTFRKKRVTIRGGVLTMPDGTELTREEVTGVGVIAGESKPPHPTYYRPVVLVGGLMGERLELPEFPSEEEAERLAGWIENNFV